MKLKSKFKLQNPYWVCFLILVIYFIFSLITLKIFPFVHSDETWLGGLSRIQLMSSSFKFTEPFFDLYPRNPHAIKLLFHLIQMPFISKLGYNIFSLRLISFLCSLLVVFLWSKLLKKTFSNPYIYLGGIFLLCFNIQFFYASHFARQEIFIVIYQLLAFLWLTDSNKKYKLIKAIILSSSIFIHPNAVIIFAFIVIYSIIKIIYKQENSTKDMFMYITILLLSVTIVVGISFWLNSDFMSDYLKFGSSLGVTRTPIEKLRQVADYVYKIFFQQSATYYMPNIKLDLMLILAVSIFSFKSLLQAKKDFNKIAAITMLISYCLVTIAVGRYNTTTIVFIIVPGLYLFLLELNSIRVLIQKLLIFSLVLLSTYSLVTQISPWRVDHYTSYSDSIFELTKGGTTLGNLNMDFAFEPYNLYDFRNLDFLEKHNLSLEDYISENKIKYIALPSEMDYISRNINRWHILYGDINTYYPELIRLINEYGEHIGTINNDFYSVRILRYIGTSSWETNIYKIDFTEKTELEQ